MLIDKFKQLNFIADVWEPHYNGDIGNGSKSEVYIAEWKIKRSKLDIKLVFSKVSPTSIYSGDWYISRKNAMKYRTSFDNNGLKCKVIPWSAFERLERAAHSPLEYA